MKRKQCNSSVVVYKSIFRYRLTVMKILLSFFWLFGFSVYAQDTCPESIEPAQDEHELVENMYWLVVNSDFERLIEEDYIHCFFNGEITYEFDDDTKLVKSNLDDIKINIGINNVLLDKNYEINIYKPTINNPYFIEGSISIQGIDNGFFPIPEVKRYFKEIEVDEAYKYWKDHYYRIMNGYKSFEDNEYPSSGYVAKAHKCIAAAYYLDFSFWKVNDDGMGVLIHKNNAFDMNFNKYNRNKPEFEEYCY